MSILTWWNIIEINLSYFLHSKEWIAKPMSDYFYVLWWNLGKDNKKKKKKRNSYRSNIDQILYSPTKTGKKTNKLMNQTTLDTCIFILFRVVTILLHKFYICDYQHQQLNFSF